MGQYEKSSGPAYAAELPYLLLKGVHLEGYLFGTVKTFML